MDPLTQWWPVVLGGVLLQWTLVFRVLLRGPCQSSDRLAWLMVLILLPGLGVVLWFLMVETVLGGRRRKRRAQLAVQLVEQTGHLRNQDEACAEVPEYEDTVNLASAVGGAPPRRGNHVDLIGDTDEVLTRLVADIDAAEYHCHLLFYIWLDDEAGRMVGAALVRASGRGVACRLVLDDVGSRAFLRSGSCRRLSSEGVRVVRALPASILRVLVQRVDMRNHRKLAVIDGRVGYTGSQNIASASFAPKRQFAPWVDCMLRIEGPAVQDLQDIFLNDDYLETAEIPRGVYEHRAPIFDDGVPVQILPSGPSHNNEALEQLTLASIHRAGQELILTTPYFVPGEAEVASLCTAARSGVRIVLVIPARCDSILVSLVARSHYPSLLDAGVEVYEYLPGLLHAKTMTVDRSLGLVTTANFDQRSFVLNYELSTLLYDSDCASHLRFLQMSYLNDSRRITSADLHSSVLRRLAQNAAGVLSPLL